MPAYGPGTSQAALDLALAAILAPATGTRNTIQGTATGVTELILRAFAGQTADIWKAQDSAGTDMVDVDSSGLLETYKGLSHAGRSVSANTTLTKNDHVVYVTSAAASGSWNAGVAALAPVLWYKLDESGTTTITDSGSGAHNGTLSGTYTQATTALLTGSTSSLTLNGGKIAISDVYDFPALAPFSIGMWVTPAQVTSTQMRMISKETTGPLEGWRMFWSTSGFSFNRLAGGTTNAITSAVIPVVGSTYFVMYTYSGTQSRLFVNPAGSTPDAGPTTHNASINGNTAAITIGKTPTDSSTAFGVFDEVMIYDYRVADADVQSLYTLGTGGGGAGPVTITLPAANAVTGGTVQRLEIYKADATGGSVTIQRAGTDTINGATSTTLNSQFQGVKLVSDGTSVWYIA